MTLPIQNEIVAAFKERDPARIANLYAEDAVFFTPGRPAIVGRNAIAEVMMEDLKDPAFDLGFAPQATGVAASGDLAYARGTFTASFTNPQTGQVGSIGGNYLQVFRKRADNSWEICEDISSPGSPGAEAGAVEPGR
jgi:uncharacterized protein (TIGR02246 family)